jgi:ubiquinone/menaquinone biosynthesis C-methylase UbiE
MKEREGHAFERVDAQPDTASWIDVLDRVRAEPQYAAYKQRAAELLDPQAGARYLEVGAGAGSDALAFAERYGVSVVGVDSSEAMVAEAWRRGLADALVADAQELPFEDDAFDGAWSDRTFQHLADPVAALRELVRVTRSGGTVVVVDPDYDTQVVGIPDQELARRVLRFRADHLLRNGTLAHQMPRLFREVGVSDVRVEAAPVVVRDATAFDNVMGLRSWASTAHERGQLPAGDVERWEHEIDEAIADGTFLYAFTLFISAARVP